MIANLITYAALCLFISAHPLQPQQPKPQFSGGNRSTAKLTIRHAKRVHVRIDPEQRSFPDSIAFTAAMTAPGSTRRLDVGRFFRNVEAYTREGDPLPVVRTGTNSWQIATAGRLGYITYNVALRDMEMTVKDHMHSGRLRRTHFFSPAYILFGLLETTADDTFDVIIDAPSGWTSIASLQQKAPNHFRARSHEHLTSSFMAGGKNISNTSFRANEKNHNVANINPDSANIDAASQFLKTASESVPPIFNVQGSHRQYSLLLEIVDPVPGIPMRKKSRKKESPASLHFIISRENYHDAWLREEISGHYFLQVLSAARLDTLVSEKRERLNPFVRGMSRYLALRSVVQHQKMDVTTLFEHIAAWLQIEASDTPDIRQSSLRPPFSPVLMNPYIVKDEFHFALLALMLDIEILHQSNGKQRLDHLFRYAAKAPHTKKSLAEFMKDATNIKTDDMLDLFFHNNARIPDRLLLYKLGLTLMRHEQGYMTIAISNEPGTEKSARRIRKMWLRPYK